MPLHTRLERIQSTTVAVAAVVIILAFWPPANDAFALAKAAIAILAGGIVVIAGIGSAVLSGGLHRPQRGLISITLAGFALALVLATATTDNVLFSILGTRGRYAGLLMYGSAIAMFLVIVRRWNATTTVRVLTGIAAAGTAVSVLALLEGADVNLTGMLGRTRFSPPTTFGNPNFSSAMAGMGLALTFAIAARRDLAPRWRWAALAAAALNAGGIIASHASQGTIAGAAAAWLVAVVWTWDAEPRWRKPMLPALLGAAAVGGATVMLGLARIGPLAGLGGQSSFRQRGWYWDAAMGMLRDFPLTGVGLDRYGDYYRGYRPLRAAVNQPLERFADNPHSVPLGMFANGGVLLGVAYLAFVGAVGWVLVRGLLRLEGAQRQRLAIAGAAWLAYQVQASVSIDIPSFVVLHLVFAGCVVALAAPVTWREVSLPWGPLVADPAAKKGKKASAPRSLRPVEYAVATVCLVVAVGMLYAVYQPLRADAADRVANQMLRAKEYQLAYDNVREAQRFADWSPVYYVTESQIDITRKDLAKAIGVLEKAALRNPRDLEALVPAARASQRLDRFDDAIAWYERALEVEPKNPRLKLEAASAYNDAGEFAGARDLLLFVLEHAGGTAAAWREIGQSYEGLGDIESAIEALEKAVEIVPDHEPTNLKLRRLRAQAA